MADIGGIRNVNRDYDSATGRYRQNDPLGFGGGQWSLYTYVGNDPLNSVDPSGLKNVLIGGNISLIAVGGGTLGAGLYISWDSPEGFDIGFYGSAGGGIGANLGAGVQVAYVPGGVSNISGQTLDGNVSAGPFQGSVSASTSNGQLSYAGGLSIGLPAGASLTTTKTGHAGYQDTANLFSGLFGSNPGPQCR